MQGQSTKKPDMSPLPRTLKNLNCEDAADHESSGSSSDRSETKPKQTAKQATVVDSESQKQKTNMKNMTTYAQKPPADEISMSRENCSGEAQGTVGSSAEQPVDTNDGAKAVGESGNGVKDAS